MFRRRLLPIICLILIFSLSGCGKREKLKNISFEDTLGLKKAKPVKAAGINICVGSMITPEEGYTCYNRLLDYIGEKLKMKVNFVEKRTYAEVNALLKDRSIDMAFVCGGPYVEGHDEFGLELLVAPMVDGKIVYYSYIIVGKNSGIEKFRDLRGKTFAFVDPLSNSGKLVPTYMLQKLGETPQGFFSKYLYSYSHDNSIKAVAQGIVDGAAVDSLIWNYLDKKGSPYIKKTKIIKISEPYGIPPVVVRPNLEVRLKEKIKKILLNMHNDKEGRDILSRMFIDRFVDVDDSFYDSIREIKGRVNE